MHPALARSIEPLELRIAPANLFDSIDGKRATWTDLDGDLVTLTTNKPILDELDFVFRAPQTGDPGFQLALLDLQNDPAQGATLTFSARRDPATKLGDGFVNVGWIYARGSDLVSIIVPGDLARLDVGDANPATMGLGNITVHSAGFPGAKAQGTTIAGGPPTVDWTVIGRLGAMTVKGDFGANLNVFGSQANPALGSTGAINILGDLLASDPALTDPGFGKGTGYIFSSGPMGAVRVAGDVFGGSGNYSGSITSTSSIASVSIGGSIYGGDGDASGQVFADGALGSVFVGRSLVSGFERDENGTPTPPFAAGSIGSGLKIGKVTIMGNVLGGMSYFGGSIFTPPGTFGKIGTVTINGLMSGHTEVIGTGQNAKLLLNGIYSDSTLGAVKVGSLQGSNPASPVNIIAFGKVNPLNATEALAIASVTVVRGGYAAQILAGSDAGLSSINPDVQIGAVKVGNAWQGSSIAAGVSSGGDIFFGNDGDVLTSARQNSLPDNPAVRSRIASVTIGSYVYGSSFDQDAFGIEAQEIGAVKIGSTVLPMTVRSALVPPDDFQMIGITRDFRVREL